MGVCEKLLAGNIISQCSMKKGMQSAGKIFNWEEVDTSEIPDDLVVNEINGQSYDVVVPGTTPFDGLAQNLEVGTYENTFSTDVPIIILNNNPEVSKLISSMLYGRFILVVENNDGGAANSNGKHQIYGWENGLTVTAVSREPYGDNPGWAVTLHEEGAGEAGIFLSDTGWNKLFED